MHKILEAAYFKILPGKLIQAKTQIKENLYWSGIGRRVKKQFLQKYKALSDIEIPEDQLKIIRFLKKHKVRIIPYDFPKKYKASDIEIFKDQLNGLHFTFYGNKKLYFKRSWSVKKIKKYYNYLLVEQDPESPHRYLATGFNIEKKDKIVDAGAAEGIFALSIIEKAGKIYLFEPDEEWVEALTATFFPWKDIVEIIPLYLGATNDLHSVTIDSYFESRPLPDFIKIDVEGHEQDVLKGSEKLLSDANSLKIAICTYHKQNDEIVLKKHLESKNFKISFSLGYVLFYYDREISDPFIRRCLIRAVKDNS